MKKYFIIFTIACLASCNIMDLNPLDKISEADTWTDQALLQLYVNGNYLAIQQGYSTAMVAAACDEVHNRHNNGNYAALQEGGITSDNVSSLATNMYQWEHNYNYIRRINTFFAKIDAAPVDESFKKASIGEMKFLRAFLYANLIRLYGGVPLITKVYGLNEDFNVPRDSYDACVDFIVKELDEAIVLLPAKQPSNQEGRASGHACMALKARVLLYAASPLNNPTKDVSKWKKAADAAAQLLNVGYKLQDNYQETFMTSNDEIIFARYFTSASSINFQWIAGRNGSGGSGSIAPSQNQINAYEMLATGELPYTEQADGTLLLNATSGFDATNPYEGRDPRFYASILYDGSIWAGRETQTYQGGSDSPDGSVGGWNASLTGYCLRKFIDEKLPITGITTHQTNPWIYFRYAEILLNYAEAKFEMGEEGVAREYLRQVRSRKSVMMPDIPVSSTGNDLRKRIQNERRVELAFEEHRFYDVRRWKIAMDTEKKDLLRININKLETGTKTYKIESLLKRTFSEHQYVMPIPRAEIDKSLNSLKQNPGY